MKTALFFLFLLVISGTTFVSAQEKPLTQTEYVKMLYALDKNFSGKDDIVTALRSRGIDFVVTDGVRSLTRSKGRNDDELKRALEEAGRRKSGGVVAKPLSEKESADVIARTRTKTLEAVDEMPDFVVKQQIQRSAAYAGTGNFRNLDSLIVAVSYRSSGDEEYRILSIGGVIQNDPKPKSDYGETGGTTSTGEFVTVLATIFKPESETKFRYVDADEIRGRKAMMFDFDIAKDKEKQQITSTSRSTVSTNAGMRGRIWVEV